MRRDIEWTVADVKAEADQRILLIMPVHKQINALALAERLRQITGSENPADWPAEYQPMVTAANAAFDAINAIRAASNTIEVMTPIPFNFKDDSFWP